MQTFRMVKNHKREESEDKNKWKGLMCNFHEKWWKISSWTKVHILPLSANMHVELGKSDITSKSSNLSHYEVANI